MEDTRLVSLYAAATELADERFGEGEALVAAVLTEKGRVLTSVYAEAAVEAACLCAETGAICEAHKLGQKVVASLCLYRAASGSSFRVLPACGVCQERLAFWGLDVLVAVPSQAGASEGPAEFKALRELRPHYWDGDA